MFAVLNKFHKKEWFSQYAVKELNSRKFRDNTGDGWVGECGVAVSSQQATYKTLAGDLGHLRGQEKPPWLGRTWERERWRSESGMGSVPLRGGWGRAGVPILGVAYPQWRINGHRERPWRDRELEGNNQCFHHPLGPQITCWGCGS